MNDETTSPPAPAPIKPAGAAPATSTSIQPETREEAIELNKTIPENKPIKEILIEEKINIENATLENAYYKIKKWYYLTDTNHIDLMLAVAISIDSPDPPLWILILGASGDSKTSIAMSLNHAPRVELIDQMTPNYLASGMKNAHDLGEKLQNSTHLLLIPDLACFSTLKTDDKKLFWGQFRTLHDGYITKGTGNDVNKKYEGCHVGLIGCGVPSFKNEQIVKDQLGTRELIYTLKNLDKNEKLLKVRKSLTHRNLKTQMEQEIKEAMQNILIYKKFNPDIITPQHIQDFIEKKVFELSLFRASASIDYYEGELFGSVDPEVPTRVAQQLDLLYRSLHSLDENYSDEKFYEIVENIVTSSSVPLRKEIYEYMVKEQAEVDKKGHILPVRKTISDLSKQFNKSRKMVKIQCLVLVELGVFNVEYEMQQLGGRSFEQEVPFFSLKEKQQKLYAEQQEESSCY